MSARPTADRISGFGTSVFSEMSRLAVEHQAINLGQGFPDFEGPDFVKDAAIAAITSDLNQYAPSHGTARLRQAIARDWARRYDREIDTNSQVTVTTGATEAIFVAMLAFLNPGDEIIFFEPFYDAYVANVAIAGASPRVVRLHAPDWHFDLDELAAAFTDKTRLFLLNTPHNPTGKVFSRSELQQIADLCQQHDVTVITDEVYDRIVFDDNEHVPIASLPGMWDRTLTINSTGKTFSMTGWKIGFSIGPEDLNAAVRAVHQFSTFATATPFQEAMAIALETAEERGYYSQLRNEYAQRRDRLRAVLADAGLPPLECQGAYFLMSDVTPQGFTNDVEFCRYLVTDVGVAAIPPSAFYLDPASAPALARFCFAKRFETIDAAAERLSRMRPTAST